MHCESSRSTFVWGWIVGAGLICAPAGARAANIALEAPAGAPGLAPGEVYEVIQNLLELRGHTVTIVTGTDVDTLDEIQQFNTVVLSGSGVGNGQDIPTFDAVIPDYVEQGGGLVIAGWVYYYNVASPGFNEVAPFEASTSYLNAGLIEITPGHEIVDGLNDWNNPSYDAYSGAMKPGAIELSRNGGTIDGAVWQVGGGRVASLGPLFTAEYSNYQTQALHNGTIPDATEMFLRAIEWTASEEAPEGCHDGDLDPGEECDDGNFANNDACVNPCVFATCGDGYTFAGVEACDDGDDDNTDACLDTCVAASCGDGYLHADVEPCDDGDDDNTDTCLDTCVLASCGDGFVFEGFEECEDGNEVDGDGCSGCQLDAPVTSTTDDESSSDGGNEGSTSDASGTETGGAETDGSGASVTAADDSDGGNAEFGGSDETIGGGSSDTLDGEGSSTGVVSASAGQDTSPFGRGVADRGCSCATDDDRSGLALSLVTLLGLFATRRRVSSSRARRS